MGKTYPHNLTEPVCAEHPHGRGENASTSAQISALLGTSPRAWGKHVRDAHLVRYSRNIPTGVGKTDSVCSPLGARTEHPHGRGENGQARGNEVEKRGTSPRAWGKLTFPTMKTIRNRNIPTGVGKTWCPTTKAELYQEHPHGRGENILAILTRIKALGTSPRAWGKYMIAPYIVSAKRNIPTGVGKT